MFACSFGGLRHTGECFIHMDTLTLLREWLRERERERVCLEKVGRGSDGERKRENRGRRVGDKEGTEREGRNTGRGER